MLTPGLMLIITSLLLLRLRAAMMPKAPRNIRAIFMPRFR